MAKRVKPSPTIKVPESGVLRACLDLLTAEKIWHIRMNTGAFLPRGSGGGIIRAARPGVADIVFTVTKNNLPIIAWCEVKSSDGKQSDMQRNFQKEVEREGHRYFLVRSVEDLKECIREIYSDAPNE